MERPHKNDIEQFIAKFYALALLISCIIVVLGGLFFLSKMWNIPVKYHIFVGEPRKLTEWSLIEQGAQEGNPAAVIQLGVMGLIVTPIINLFFCLIYFLFKKDIVYILSCIFVLLVLLSTVFGIVI